MENQINSLFRKLIRRLSAWMLVLSIIQGICIYYFVTRYTAHKIAAQTDVINKQTDTLIAEMKNFPSVDEVNVLEKNIDKIEKEMGTKIEAMERDILKELSPTLKIISQKPFYVNRQQVKFIYSIENKGRYSVNINNMKLYLSNTKIESANNIKNQLILNKEFYLRTNMIIGDIAPGQDMKNDLTIEFGNSQKIPETVYYCVTFDAQTDPNIIKAIKTIDKEKIDNKKFYYILGDIITPG